ncbi:MAG: hypothetical protein J6S30_00985 [Kiritimatiellae bacterium]|nr:hypothetical protein [Kiritimatiellia bacterium]
MKGNTRRAAAFAMVRWLQTHDFPQSLLPRGEGRAEVQDMLFTAIRRLRPLRKVLGELLPKWPKGELEALLYIGAVQILYMPSIPDFAAVNETVEAAKVCENRSIARVVNGTLRNLIRRKEEFLEMLAASPLEVRESLPTQLARRWTERYGAEGAEALAVWHNTPAETFLAYPNGEYKLLPRAMKVENMDGFTSGGFIVQDPATRFAVDLISPAGGERILDACAAPGGKAIQMAWRGADVTACEVNPARRRKLEENIARTKVPIKVISELFGGPYDKILVDAPCSNTGVLRRRPDARWNWTEDKLRQLVALQADILDVAAKLLVPGGRLVYSTCSNEPEENAMQVEAFLERHSEFSFVEATESVPFDSGCDGAFAAAMIKR